MISSYFKQNDCKNTIAVHRRRHRIEREGPQLRPDCTDMDAGRCKKRWSAKATWKTAMEKEQKELDWAASSEE